MHETSESLETLPHSVPHLKLYSLQLSIIVSKRGLGYNDNNTSTASKIKKHLLVTKSNQKDMRCNFIYPCVVKVVVVVAETGVGAGSSSRSSNEEDLSSSTCQEIKKKKKM